MNIQHFSSEQWSYPMFTALVITADFIPRFVAAW